MQIQYLHHGDEKYIQFVMRVISICGSCKKYSIKIHHLGIVRATDSANQVHYVELCPRRYDKFISFDKTYFQWFQFKF